MRTSLQNQNMSGANNLNYMKALHAEALLDELLEEVSGDDMLLADLDEELTDLDDFVEFSINLKDLEMFQNILKADQALTMM